MLNRSIYFATVLAVLAVPRLAVSQQAASPQTAPSTSQHAVAHYYRLNFVLRELDEAKLINQRAYTMTLASEGVESCRLRAGSRIPIGHDKDVSYVDIGVNLDVRGKEAGDALQLEVTAEVSSSGGENGATAGVPPVIRQVRSQGTILAAIGKPIAVFTADDPASKHRFELEVTPARER